MDNRLTYRATLLKEWMGSESYALVQTMLKEIYESATESVIHGTKEHFDSNAGYLRGLMTALRLAEQVVLDESRQRPQET